MGEPMKVLAAIAVFILVAGFFPAVLYAIGAFITFDFGWLVHHGEAWRIFFLFVSVPPTVFAIPLALEIATGVFE